MQTCKHDVDFPGAGHADRYGDENADGDKNGNDVDYAAAGQA